MTNRERKKAMPRVVWVVESKLQGTLYWFVEATMRYKKDALGWLNHRVRIAGATYEISKYVQAKKDE